MNENQKRFFEMLAAVIRAKAKSGEISDVKALFEHGVRFASMTGKVAGTERPR